MIVRRVAIHLGALLCIACCARSFAATPLVIAELENKRTIAEADVARSSAEYELAAWRLAQLKQLKSRGHASWQEVAQQEVTAKAAAATAQAAEQYLQALLQWQNRLAKSSLPQTGEESECIKLYMPRTARLVAWIPTEAATLELSKRHLEHLRSEHQSMSEIDLASFDAVLKKAKRAVEVYRRAEEDADLLSRAEIRLRLATAEYERARARKQFAGIIARRIDLVSNSLPERKHESEEPSLSIAQGGTRFVDATSDRELAQLVETMATDESTTSAQVAWLQHRRNAVLDRIEALTSLSAANAADPGELMHAKQQAADLQLQITVAQDALEVHQQTAGVYQQTLNTQPTDVREPPKSKAQDRDLVASAAVVRHCLDLQQLQLKLAASRASVEAQFDYLSERARRVERIPADARPPKELENLHHQVQGLQLQLTAIDRELELLDLEQRRFLLQVESQQGDPYQLVQAGDGTFIPRKQFERGQELLGLIGFVGDPELVFNLPSTYSYIESPIVLDCIHRLSFQSTSSPASILHRTVDRPRNCLMPPAQMSAWEAALAANGVQWAAAAISYPWDRFSDTPYRLRRRQLDDRSVPYDYLRTSVTCGYRSYYPYGSYAFGLSRPSQFSLQSRMPPVTSFPYRSSYIYRSAWPTRNTPYSNSFLRPIDCY